MNNTCVVFDLDDTLYFERDFVKSAFREIADTFCTSQPEKGLKIMIDAFEHGENAFQTLLNFLNDSRSTVDILLKKYHEHLPQIKLREGAHSTLATLRSNHVPMGLVSDGRSLTQRNKLRALTLYEYFDERDIIISEEFGSCKPDERNYRYFMDRFPHCQKFIYVGDNIDKDFLAPNMLGWTTICILDEGFNIHKQDFTKTKEYLPHKMIHSLSEIIKFI